MDLAFHGGMHRSGSVQPSKAFGTNDTLRAYGRRLFLALHLGVLFVPAYAI